MYYDALEEIEGNIPEVPEDPNDREVSNTTVYKISNVSDADNFSNLYNHANGYNGLKLGQFVQIYNNKYGRYVLWLIVGFDCEYNHTASDGTIKSNGYGICLLNWSSLSFGNWSSTTSATPYINSTPHTESLPAISNDLLSIIGSYLVNRNVLLSSSVNSTTYQSTAYTWTTSYCTLPSVCQIIGEAGNHDTIYDDGEANYQFPLYNKAPELWYGDYNSYKWTRNITKLTSSSSLGVYTCKYTSIGAVVGNPNFQFSTNVQKSTDVGSANLYAPLIYIR